MPAIDFGPAAFVGATACAALMGLAIQRGATCTVAAVDECLRQRRASRLLAMLEASVCVLAGLLLLRALGLGRLMPAGHGLGAATVAGAALLGVGAAINGACVFGAVARLGCGQWAYACTPLGYYLGCVVFHSRMPLDARPLDALAPALQASALALLACAAWLAWRALRGWQSAFGRTAALARLEGQARVARLRATWNPHAATIVIGITFLLLLVLAGPWTYTDALARWARGTKVEWGLGGALFLALWAGAVAGGVLGDKWAPVAPTVTALSRCLLGGFLMGVGSLWVPGGNDGLILLGMPLLWPYAWVAFAVMCSTVAASLLLAARVRRAFACRGRGPVAGS